MQPQPPLLSCSAERHDGAAPAPAPALDPWHASLLAAQQRQLEDALRALGACRGRQADEAFAGRWRDRIVRRLVPRWHFAMLNDVERNVAYSGALREAVVPDGLVLDIGSGAGLLAMMAARHGARSVISCEAVRPLAEAARRIVAANGLSGRVRIVPELSIDLAAGRDLPRPADLLVTEIVDCGLLGEGILPAIRHARRHLLRPDAQIIPRSARVYAALLESPTLAGLNRVGTVSGFDLAAFNEFSSNYYYPVRLNTWPHRFLTRPELVFAFDFKHDPLGPGSRRITLDVLQDGRAHAVLFWFELDLDLTGRHVLSNHPGNLRTHWMQAAQSLHPVLDVSCGRAVQVTAEHDDFGVWFTPETEAATAMGGTVS